MTMEHLTDDDLVLHFYGELEAACDTRAMQHLSHCDGCRERYGQLQRVMAAVDSMPALTLPDNFERAVWARLEPALPARRGWLSWLVLSPGNLAWATAVVLLVAGAFFAGRMSHLSNGDGGAQLASAEQIRERVILLSLGEHLDRSQTMLVELVSADPDAAALDLTVERERAQDLVAANRLYRQTANQTGDVAVGQLLDELERLLVELAASPDRVEAEDMERVKQRIAAKDLLFKVRVVSTTVRERQQQQIRGRARAGQSS